MVGAEEDWSFKVIVSLSLLGASLLFGQIYIGLVLKPKRARSRLEKQGIRGPSPVFLYGNIPEITRIHIQAAAAEETAGAGGENLSHAWPAKVFPHLQQWRNQYGPIFVYSSGNIQTLCIMDPEMVKELSTCTSLNLGKPAYLSKDRGPLLGQGILSSNGAYWAFQRKIIAPEFYLDKVKGLTSLMFDSTSTIIRSWESKMNGERAGVEISVDEDMRNLSADIISRGCFGSSYSQGKEIFLKLHALQQVMSKGNIGVPGSRFIPTKTNRDMWRLKEEIDTMILNVIKARRETQHDKDLLQLILDAANNDGNNNFLPNDVAASWFIIDNCKNIYFAGHETTAISLSWCLVLLAAYPDWQALVREEVLEICGDNPPDVDKVRMMKLLNQVILETLRLYPPAVFVGREALQDISLKGIEIPKGTYIQIPISFLHQHGEIWGRDVHKFNPGRFEHGISRACKTPQAYMPFGVGTRNCLGQHFAMMELKVILSAFLSRFSFSLSPAYQHSPAFQLVIKPQYGVKLHVRALE
ncbi:OLC1v1000260C1 [Oldenlandia corymbosa var. corymbosa]|uniref:OLC1v1000260C1 n=1 Tax=Oldenlandia corymbosa var. corymbosa TaxID=529605 RepID=A0AAV1D2T9_OLDCO|nr:OLC1v1000260C1 [Oldenlandia corymbosa var. corymbosa]